MDYVTVSAKVRRGVWEKLRRYNINVSEVIREAILKRVREEEVKWAVNVMDEISSKSRLRESSPKVIRRFRDGR